ncbi:TPA: ATP-binding cassette domain-containing protein, partial [Streptococcus agalactiae]
MSCLEISDLTKSYDKKTILNNINLTIDSGKIVGLLGENGAGKSTLMKCIVGLVKIDSGEINFKFKGKNKLGFLIEYPAFYPNLSAFDNLKIFASLLDIKNERISEVIKEVGLYKYTDVIFD